MRAVWIRAISERDAMNTLSKTLLFSAIALIEVQASAQQKPSEPASQNAQVKSCVLIHAVNPKFPPDASIKKKRGDIVLHAAVASDGSVKNVTEVSGEPKLVGSAINAVRQYQFAPCIQDGRPIESQTTITVSYDLRREAFYPEDASSNLPKQPQEDVIHEIERGELFQLRDGVTFPKALHVVNPKYSDAARKSKFEGYVSLGVVVGTDGKPRSVWLVRVLGEGLDENTLDAVSQWIFTPATKEGKPVPVLINIAMPFRL
jgi:TonB family protein